MRKRRKFGSSNSNVPPIGQLGFTPSQPAKKKIVYARAAFIWWASYSGAAIDQIMGSGLPLDKTIVLTASTKNESPYTTLGDGGPYGPNEHLTFIYAGVHAIYRVFWWDYDVYGGIIPNIGSISLPSNLKYLFDKGYESAQNNYKDATPLTPKTPTSSPQSYNIDLAITTYF